MKQILKKLGSVFLTLCMVLSMLPTPAFAADASIDITGKTMAVIQSEIQTAIDAAATGDTVTVTGTATVTDRLSIDIPAGVTVAWKASLTTTATLTSYFLTLVGDGTFEIKDGGVVSSTNSTAISTSSTGSFIVSGGTVSSDNFAIYNGSTGRVLVSGGTVENTGTGSAIQNSSTGIVRVSGNAIVQNSSNSNATIRQNNSGTNTADRIIIEGGTVENTGTGTAIQSSSIGGVLVSGGTVSAAGGFAISNSYTGRIAVSGGRVENTGGGNAIYNYGTGEVTVSSGTVSALTNYAIRNGSTGVIRVSGDAVVQNNSDSSATILQETSGTDTADRIIIEGGTVKNTGKSTAIYNGSPCGVVVSGGTVSATDGAAIYNNSTGVVSVSGNAIVQNSSNSNATIMQNYSGTDTEDRIIIDGGTVKNDGNNSAISNDSTGGVAVSGGTVSSTGGSAIYNSSTGGLTVSGGTVSSNSFTIVNAIGAVKISGGTVSSSDSHALYNRSTGAITVSGGTVLSGGKAAIYNNSTGAIAISGGIVLAPGSVFADVIYDSSSTFTENSITGPSVVLAVASDAFTLGQSSGTSTNLCLWKTGGKETPVTSAEWARQSDLDGLLVTSLEPDFFVSLDGVTVILAPKSADFTAPKSLTYDGTAKAYTMPSDMEATIYYEGTGTTTYPNSNTAPTDAGTYKVTAKVVNNTVYCAEPCLEIGTMTINAKTITPSMIGEISVQNYTGQKIAPAVTVTDGTALVKDTDYTISYSELATVTGGGTVTVTGGGNYTGSVTKNFTVSPLVLTIDNATLESKTYDGSTTATVTGVTLSGDVDNMVLGTDFTAAGTFDDANVGSGKSVTITVMLENTDKAKNYIVSGNYLLINQAIAKGAAPMVSNDAISHINTVTGEKTVSIAALVPADAGTTSFAAGSKTDSSTIISAWSVDANGMVTYTLNGGTVGDTASLPINVFTENYQDFTINVVITLTDKYVPSVSVDNISATYADSLVIRGSATIDSSTVAGTWSFVTDTSSLTIGSNTVTVIFTPTDSDTYAEVTHIITVTLSKATPTGEPNYTKITTSEKTLTDAVLTTEGGTFSIPGTVDWVLTGTSSVQKNIAYSWLFTPTDTTHFNTLSGSITLYAHSSSGTSSSGGSSTPATPAPTISGSTATTTVTAKTNSDGTATASVTRSQMSITIKAAQKAAQSTGDAPQVEIEISSGSDASTVETTLPKAAVQALVTGEMESLSISGSMATMTFDAQALASIVDAASGDVTISMAQLENNILSDAAAQVVGDRPVYNFSVTSGSNTISPFGGVVTVSVPYIPAAGEDVNAIVAYYINADGEPELMQNCYYDAEAGMLVFTTTHFSTYAVGYNKIAFSDISDAAWYAEAVSYLAAREITSGTTETTFSPDSTLTRGQFMTLLMRAYDIDPDDSSADNFSDAGNTYYTGYLAAAKRLEISNGVGDNLFEPDQAITRQDMFTLLYNALKVIDQLPEGNSGTTLSEFTDIESISSYAQDAMAYLVETGVVGGNNGQLNPTDTTTRAQMAQVLYNLLSK